MNKFEALFTRIKVLHEYQPMKMELENMRHLE